jgi:hypothetical protein
MPPGTLTSETVHPLVVSRIIFRVHPERFLFVNAEILGSTGRNRRISNANAQKAADTRFISRIPGNFSPKLA